MRFFPPSGFRAAARLGLKDVDLRPRVGTGQRWSTRTQQWSGPHEGVGRVEVGGEEQTTLLAGMSHMAQDKGGCDLNGRVREVEGQLQQKCTWSGWPGHLNSIPEGH